MEKKFVYFFKNSPKDNLGITHAEDEESASEYFAQVKNLPIDKFLEIFIVEEWK